MYLHVDLESSHHEKKILYVWWWMLTGFIVVNILQYIEISNHYVVHLKPYIKKKKQPTKLESKMCPQGQKITETAPMLIKEC